MNHQLRLFGLLSLLFIVVSSCSKKDYALFSYRSMPAQAGLKVHQALPPDSALVAKAIQVSKQESQATVESFGPSSDVATEQKPLLVTTADASKVMEEVKQMSLMEKISLAKEVRKVVKDIKEGKKIDATKAGGNQLIALILVLVFGLLIPVIGIHRFYLGYPLQGVLQMVTFGCCGIWWLIDAIRILTGDLKPKGGEYTEVL